MISAILPALEPVNSLDDIESAESRIRPRQALALDDRVRIVYSLLLEPLVEPNGNIGYPIRSRQVRARLGLGSREDRHSPLPGAFFCFKHLAHAFPKTLGDRDLTASIMDIGA